MHGTEHSSDVNFVLIFIVLLKRSPYYEINKISASISEIINIIKKLLFSDISIFYLYKNKTKNNCDNF